MEYTKRTISLPTQLHDKLSKENNASGTIAQALELWYTHKQTVRTLAEKSDMILKQLERLQPANVKPEEQTTGKVMRPLYEGGPPVLQDLDNGTAYNKFLNKWQDIDEIEF